jgi:hypothetical protein
MISLHTVHRVAEDTSRPPPAAHRAVEPVFALSLFALAGALIVNTVLGPLGTGTIEYPITGTLLNQTLGLEAVTVGLVVPLTLVAGLLAARGHRAAPFLAFGPAAYTAYMFVQYVLGPEYDQYSHIIVFHTALFTLAAALTISAWMLASYQPRPQLTTGVRRGYGALLLLLGAFIVSRYLPVITDGALPPEFAQARTFFWSIFFLDLGIIVPATLVAGIGLLRGAPPAHTALYALMGWYALVPPSVAAMSATMVINNDPHAVTGQAVMFGVVAVIVAALATWIFLPVLHTPSQPADATPLELSR